MGYTNGTDPHGQFARRKALVAKLAALDAELAVYGGDHNGRMDLVHHQQDIVMHLGTLPGESASPPTASRQR
jgi:hypothetical protein